MPDEIIFRGAATDAAFIEQNVLPGTFLEPRERRAKLVSAAGSVIEITAVLGAIGAALPGRLGALFGALVSGVEKDPATGKPHPGKGTAVNFAPSPIGFLDPTALGLPRNFYLPAGASNTIPPFADRLGLGFPEQRREDEARQLVIDRAVSTSRVDQARKAVESESDETLQRIIAGQGGFTRAGVIFATSEVPAVNLQIAARAEQIRRARTIVPGLVPAVRELTAAVEQLRIAGLENVELAQDIGADLDAEQRRLLAEVAAANPLGGPVAMGSSVPQDFEPVNDAAKRNQRAARGINRELHSERADP